MTVIDTVPAVKFWREGKEGSMRIGETRVSLDSVYYQYVDGMSADEIAENFPSLRLSEVYATIAYILDNRDYVEEYIRENEIQAAKAKAMIEEKFGNRNAELRKKLLIKNEERIGAIKP